MRTSGHPPSRAGGHERWLRPVVRSHSGLSHGEGIGWVAGCEMPDDGGEEGPGLVLGPLWANVGQTGVLGRHPDPIRRGEGHSSLLRKLVNMNPGIMVAQS